MKRWSWVAAALLPMGCSLGTDAEPDRAPVLFEIEYVNYAATPVWRGFFIDSDAMLYSFDRSAEQGVTPPQKTEFTYKELIEKFGEDPTKVRGLAAAEVTPIALLIPAAAQGQIATPGSSCADTGVLSFRAYIFDHTRQVFKAVVIRREGDALAENQAAAAQQIYRYLDGLRLTNHIEGCQP